jgi:hypothetical protein
MHFPFPDCVELAKAGITAVIQPGGSIKDELSINYCNENKVAMVQELVILNINLFNFARHNFITTLKTYGILIS